MQHYIHAINQLYQTGQTTEHSFRGDLQQLLQRLLPTDYTVVNEPKRRDCGAPDYIIERNGLPIGFIEAKDIGDKDLLGVKKTGNKAQFDRYKASLSNLIFTDYLRFFFFKNGELYAEIALADIQQGKIEALSENFSRFKHLIQDFTAHVGQNIKSAKKLAELMAGKARLLADVIERALDSDEENDSNSSLHHQLESFRDVLIHDLTHKGFADVYAQTITYGLFAARLHDSTLPNFSRQEAMELIPKSNPFLRNLFSYISGVELDDRIKWIVDHLVGIFLCSDVKKILENYGRSTKTNEPIIHFYETFLSEYDSSLRKARGVWYTPAPVVNFIVRAVDDILKTEFGLAEGLADDSKITIQEDVATKKRGGGSKLVKIDKEVHRVQILDPATGTGTFLSSVVKHIYANHFANMGGMWSSYVEENLIPRLNGFEILMASYAMAHLQLDLLLTSQGYQPTKNQRFKIYLTNSLEEYHEDTGTLFTSWLSNEANEANYIKRDTPVMVVMGNPPYSGESANKGEWIMNLMEDYKKEPGSDKKLKEKNPKWINDDYVKFLRYGQYFIEQKGAGIVAFINPHGFLDNPTFRGMRYSLLKTYDKIYTIDLHGNSKKKEVCLDGSKDENVFDIMQGVSINFFIKTGKKDENELAQVFHFDLYGKREDKYNFLNSSELSDIGFIKLENRSPNYFMVQKNFASQSEYEKGILLTDLFSLNNVGIVTSRDSFVVDFDKSILAERIKDFTHLSKDELIIYYGLKENKSWKINEVKEKIAQFDEDYIQKYVYRPFDVRFIYYHQDMIERGRVDVMQHFIHEKENIGLVFKLGNAEYNSVSVMVTENIIDFRSWSRAGMQGGDYIAPLYTYTQQLGENGKIETIKKANLNKKIVEKILSIGLLEDKQSPKFNPEIDRTLQFAPYLLDYIYAVLHSPAYRERYKEFLKIDFPRVPYPKSAEEFWQLSQFGTELRQLHLLKAEVALSATYPQTGDNLVGKIKFDGKKVWINDTQYFDNVSQTAWNFYIGGYQPAQKWLKDRKERALSRTDVLHYMKILATLDETARLMAEIDESCAIV